MAAKKKAKAAPKKAGAAKAAATPKAVEAKVALRLLETLPPIDSKRRRLYLKAFSDDQCMDWGSATKAAQVLADAERFIGSVAPVLAKKSVPTYSKHRFAWLCSLVTELADAVNADQSVDDAKLDRKGIFVRGDKLRRRLADALYAAAHGDESLEAMIASRNDTPNSQSSLETSLAGLLQLATNLRRSDDGELLADDVGLTAEFLSGVTSSMDALEAANERRFDAAGGKDSADTNRIEGRVLREMNFAAGLLKRAKDEDRTITLPPPGTALTAVRSASGASKAKAKAKAEGIPDPDATPPPES